MRFTARILGLLTVAVLAALVPSLKSQGLVDISIVPDGGGRHPHWPRRPPEFRPIRIEKHIVKTVIEEGVAKTTVEQSFLNQNPVVLEGTYLFPISDEASITEFTMTMNGKVVKGEVVEKDKAREIYEGIVRRQRDPALLEYAGKRLFKASVFPLTPNAPVDISLTYVEQLRNEAGLYEYRYPLRTQSYSPGYVGTVAVAVSVRAAAGVKTVFSSSHQVSRSVKSDAQVDVAFEGREMEASKDFNLYYSTAAGGVGFALLSDHSAVDGGWFMMTLAPKREYAKEEIAPKDVVFIVDTSGSMRDDQKMEQARQALKQGLKTLAPTDRFQIVGFSTDVRSFAERMMEASEAVIAEALLWVDKLSADGGTNIADALTTGLKVLPIETGRVGMVVFLTDGTPTVGETRAPEILKAAMAANARKARIFVFGVGHDVNTQLLDSVAEDSRGARDYVVPGQNMEIVLSRFFDRVAYPVLSDIVVQVDGVKIDEVYPKVMPDLFKGSELALFGRYSGSGTHAVRVKGKVAGKEVEYVFEGKFVDKKSDRDFIATLWARRKVGYLWDQIRLNGFNNELKDEIVRLGKKYAIATPYTSFLVTEDGRPITRPGGPPTSALGGRGGRLRDGSENGRERLDGQAKGDQGDLDQEVFQTVIDHAANPNAQPAEKSGMTEGADGAPDDPATLSAGGKGLAGAIGIGGSSAGATPGGRRPADGKKAVEESKVVRKLKDAGLEDEARTDSTTSSRRRIGEKTFTLKDGLWSDDESLALAPDVLSLKEKVVVAYSKEYFEIIRAHPELARWLTALTTVRVMLGDQVLKIVPALEVPEKEEAPSSQPVERKP